MSEEKKPEKMTIIDKLNRIVEEMCDNYCKWPLLYGDGEEEKLLSERCDKCPLMWLEAPGVFRRVNERACMKGSPG